ncbi:MAG: gamma-glutamyl-gamma-aminobutyrate hydrolase family protein [Caldilineaceae bacterium]
MNELRPMIGIPTWSDVSQVYSGVPLSGINQSYIATLQKVGAIPILIPLGLDTASLRGIFQRIDGLFLGGGGDIAPRLYEKGSREVLETTDLERDWTELTLTRWALDENMPMLGVCRGIQVMNVACGGTLHRDLRNHGSGIKHDYIFPHYKRDRISHQVSITEGCYLHNIFGDKLSVNSMHYQGVADVGAGLQVMATAEDGLPEALAAKSHIFAQGFQWHPEELLKNDVRNAAIFNDFLQAARSDWRN